jgi:hypothetical protein
MFGPSSSWTLKFSSYGELSKRSDGKVQKSIVFKHWRCYLLAGAIGYTGKVTLGLKGCYGVGCFYKTTGEGCKRDLPNDLQTPANPSKMFVQKGVKGVHVLRQPIQTISNCVALVLNIQGEAFEVFLSIKQCLDTSNGGCEAPVKDGSDGFHRFLLEVNVNGAYEGEGSADPRSNGTGWLIRNSGRFGRKLKFDTL